MWANKDISAYSRPVYIIGAGGIVVTAHLPAYKIAGFDVKGIYDVDSDKAKQAAENFGIPHVFASLDEMVRHAPGNAVFDIAIPANDIAVVLKQLPSHAAVLMQKPMGDDLVSAREILRITDEKGMIAAVNFQLRYAPFILEAKRMIGEGMLGELYDMRIDVDVYTPWHLWNFLFKAPRVEILYHSIHYIDLLRSFLGNPQTVFAKTTGHPAMKDLASVRSNIIMDYGDRVRASISTNHTHLYGPEKQQSCIQIQGSEGAIRIHMGVLKDYPHGEPDRFEYTLLHEGRPTGWKEKQIDGGWFPHAFIGSMEQVMMAAVGMIELPDNSVKDAIYTMACVEAAYESSKKGGIVPEY
jgi:predicted dehydrogenase